MVINKKANIQTNKTTGNKHIYSVILVTESKNIRF